jgi:hypothetical protein
MGKIARLILTFSHSPLWRQVTRDSIYTGLRDNGQPKRRTLCYYASFTLPLQTLSGWQWGGGGLDWLGSPLFSVLSRKMDIGQPLPNTVHIFPYVPCSIFTKHNVLIKSRTSGIRCCSCVPYYPGSSLIQTAFSSFSYGTFGQIRFYGKKGL